jgi:hypothetical protein
MLAIRIDVFQQAAADAAVRGCEQLGDTRHHSSCELCFVHGVADLRGQHVSVSFITLKVWGVEPVVTNQTSWLERATSIVTHLTKLVLLCLSKLTNSCSSISSRTRVGTMLDGSQEMLR